MIQMTDEMKDSINTARTSGYPCIVSTASKDGVPNSGYIGTVMALDDSSLAFRDRGGGGSLMHLEENPKVIILYRDSARELGWKFRCTATIHREGPDLERVEQRLVEAGVGGAHSGAAVILQIDQVLTLFGEVLQEREPGLRW